MPRMLSYFIIRVSSRWERKRNSLRGKKRRSRGKPGRMYVISMEKEKKRKKIIDFTRKKEKKKEKYHHLGDDTI